ncbi:MAG: ABC transporter ATP-binding protein [Saprospiraceae bacterium]
MLGILFVFLSNVFRVIQPQVIREALDKIVAYIKTPETLQNSEILIHQLMIFGLIVLGCALMMGLFMYFMRQTIIVMSRLIEYDQRKDIFAHYLKLDIAFYKRNKTGDIMSRISEDVNKVRMYFGPAFLYGFNLISLFVVVIFTMFKVNFTLAFYTLLPLPLLSIVIYKVSNLINKRSEKIQRQLAKITTIAQEAFSGIRIIKSFNTGKNWEDYFNKETKQYKKLSLDLAQVDSMFFPAMFLLVGISTLITIYIGGLSVFEGSVTPGNIAEFVIYINMLTWPVSAIGWCASIIQQAEASQVRINEFLNTQPEIKNDKDAIKEISSFDIEYKNLSFSYPENAVLALSNINLKIPEKTSLAIVGKTASGKSSMVELLLRMYDATAGELYLGGVDIRKLSVSALRRKIAYVPQDVFLFSDTIENNILFGMDSKIQSNFSVLQASQVAAVDVEINSFTDQYLSIIGERGVTLSGGQKQRISIARAMIMDADIIILDDCLSAVDHITEEEIFNQIMPLVKDKTLILITHRISQTRYMDKVLVLSDHQVKEYGTYEELLDKKGMFYRMYQIENDHKKVSIEQFN